MEELLISRVDDIIDRAEKGMFAYGDFLNETEAALIERYISGRGLSLAYRFWGGFEGALRKRLFVYPDYYDFEYSCDCISSVEIRGSGYTELSHSSFLGALMSLGIDRSRMGDIVARTNSCILFADIRIVRFLLSSPSPLTRVGRDAVKLVEFVCDNSFSVAYEFKEYVDTVSSPRIDCVVSSLISLSRERTKGIVQSGLVSVNYIVECRPDSTVCEGDTVTVRGYGKFIISSLSDKTRKGRYRLIAKKYI